MKIEEARYISFAPADSRCGESARISGVVIAELDGKPPGIFYQLTHDDGTVAVVSVDDPTGWVHDPAGNRISVGNRITSDHREAESPSAAEVIQQGLMAAVARLVGRVKALEHRADLEQKCSLVRMGMSASEVDRSFAKSDEATNGTADPDPWVRSEALQTENQWLRRMLARATTERTSRAEKTLIETGN